MPDRAARPGAEPSGNEVEVTPEMIVAGVEALERFDEFFEPKSWAVISVFQAMERARTTTS